MTSTSVISLDLPLKDARVTKASFKDDRTVLEHDVALWDPSRIDRLYKTTLRSYRGRPSLTDDGSVMFTADAARRSQELDEFLALGRILVVFLPAPDVVWVGTGKTTTRDGDETRVVEPKDVHRLIPGRPDLRKGRGTRMEAFGDATFVDFWRRHGAAFQYEALIEDPTVEPIVRIADSQIPVAGRAKVGGGQVWYLPRPVGLKEPDHEAFTTSLLRLVTRAPPSATEVPEWLAGILAPSETSAQRSVAAAETDVLSASGRRDEEVRLLKALQRPKQLVVASGEALEVHVEEALVALGAEVLPGKRGRTDRIVRWKDHVAVVEVKGLSKSARERDAAQLEKWVSDYAVDHDAAPKGILVVNGWLNTPLSERDQPVFPDQMLDHSVRRRHCLVETSQLLAAVYGEVGDTFLNDVFGTSGRLLGYDWRTVLTFDDSDETAGSEPVETELPN